LVSEAPELLFKPIGSHRIAFNLVITLPVLIFSFRETKGLSLEEIDLMFGDRALGNLPADIEKDGGVVAVTNTHDERPKGEL
jgi:hypothetical protein